MCWVVACPSIVGYNTLIVDYSGLRVLCVPRSLHTKDLFGDFEIDEADYSRY
jgi:hypothetical protein